MATRINTPAAPTKPVAPATKRKATATQAPGLDKTHAADVEDDVETLREKLMAQFRATWTRERVVAMVLGIVTTVATGLLLNQLVGALVVAVMATTTSAFLATLVAVLAYIVVAYASGVLGGVVYEYVACGAAREHVGLIGRTVRGWFGSKPALA